MTETAKERFYREELESIKLDLLEARPVSPSNIAKALIEADELPVTTDKLSVEKLQEQLNTAKMALTEIAEIIDYDIHECDYGCDDSRELNGSLDMYSVIESALAEIGGDDEN